MRHKSAIVAIALALPLAAQQPDPPPPADKPAFENWNLYYQATSIGMYHGTFPSPYTGPLSLQDYSERDVSLTTTLFLCGTPGTKHGSGV
jgi:hypothetical protein